MIKKLSLLQKPGFLFKALRVSLNGSLAFDTSVKLIIQLLFGHTLDIIPELIRFDANALLEYLTNHQIDVFDCTPSQLELLILAGLLSKTLSVPKVVLIGGRRFMKCGFREWNEVDFPKQLSTTFEGCR
jgi:non-ribosomal peptide synthetase component F